MVRFAFFGKLADVMGRTYELALPRAKMSVGEVVAHLCEIDPAFREALLKTTAKFAVRQAIVDPGHIVEAGDEIAVLPPFSGG